MVWKSLLELKVKVKAVSDEEHERVRLHHEVVLTQSENVEGLALEV